MNAETEEKKTSIYIYAKKVLEVNSKTSVEEITNEYESKKLELETELEKVTDKDNQVVIQKFYYYRKIQNF